ncbi:hypothetical protein [Aestuariibius sp. HNIBRBA575]|uniref:hypothetical protein n=1 Tax=Aestuariibius sp. HNIBRBA575 TaxID=3233343 RepID=UPI0034A18B17
MIKKFESSIAVLATFAITLPMPVLSRQMECSYDFVTHATTLKLDDLNEPRGSIFYSYNHSISPTGGEEMYLFTEDNPDELQGAGQMKFIMENLYFDPTATISAIEYIDFEVPTLKQFQAPAAYFEQSADRINAPLAVWSCYRTD